MRFPPLTSRCYHTPQPPAASRPDPISPAPIRYDFTVPRRSHPAGSRGRSIASLRSLAMRFHAPVTIALFSFHLAMSMTPDASAQPPKEEFNYDEAKVRAYTLPDLLMIPEGGAPDGEAVSTPEAWRTVARPRCRCGAASPSTCAASGPERSARGRAVPSQPAPTCSIT